MFVFGRTPSQHSEGSRFKFQLGLAHFQLGFGVLILFYRSLPLLPPAFPLFPKICRVGRLSGTTGSATREGLLSVQAV